MRWSSTRPIDPRGDVARSPSPIATLSAIVADEGDDGLGRADRRDDRLDRDREQDEAGAVVEEALAVDHRRQRRRARAGA